MYPRSGKTVALTAFVSHHDTSRHDPGWGHPDHQGRIPAIVRTVYRDMLTLHGHVLEVEAVPATEDDLLLVHTPEYVEGVRRVAEAAAREGASRPFDAGVVVSGASWDAALAAAGSAITGAEVVLAGEARNAFCAARPPGRGASAGRAGGHSLFNNVAVAARHLRERRGMERVLVVDWGARAAEGTGTVLRGDPGIRFLSVHQHPTPALVEDAEPGPPPGAPRPRAVGVAPGTDGAGFGVALAAGLADALAGWTPDFILLSAGMDILAGDPLGGLGVQPREVYDLTLRLRETAERGCGGRLVSVLEGGYDAAATGAAVVQHLRALAGLPPA
ncbi:MAG TPA: hypothetical protein VHG28_02580 [Longimicrobiaceae bacterium]|nr:hypothetical protein [Longimicrobiaceae bacterium]